MLGRLESEQRDVIAFLREENGRCKHNWRGADAVEKMRRAA
jgi:hypothetical protein